MKSYMLVLVTVLITFLTEITFIGAFYWYSLVPNFGPMALSGFIVFLVLFAISFDKDYRHLRLGAICCVIVSIMFMAAYVIMCLRTGRDINFLDFFLHRVN